MHSVSAEVVVINFEICEVEIHILVCISDVDVEFVYEFCDCVTDNIFGCLSAEQMCKSLRFVGLTVRQIVQEADISYRNRLGGQFINQQCLQELLKSKSEENILFNIFPRRENVAKGFIGDIVIVIKKTIETVRSVALEQIQKDVVMDESKDCTLPICTVLFKNHIQPHFSFIFSMLNFSEEIKEGIHL